MPIATLFNAPCHVPRATAQSACVRCGPGVSWRTFGAKPNGCPVGIDRPSLASLPWGRLDAATAESVYVCMYGRVARGDWEKYNLGAMSVSPVYDLRTNTLFVPLGMLDVSMNHAHTRPDPTPPLPTPSHPSPPHGYRACARRLCAHKAQARDISFSFRFSATFLRRRRC